MNFVQNTAINIYSILILLVVLFHFIKTGERDTLQYKLFFGLLVLNIALLVFDTMGGFDGNPTLLHHLGDFFLFLLYPIPACLWLMYAHLKTFKNEKRTIKLIYPLLALNLINIALLLLTFIKRDGFPKTGALYYIQISLPIALLAATTVIVIINRPRISKKHFTVLMLFPVFPIAFFVFQTLTRESSILVNSIVISLVMIFLNIQDKQIYTDHLTGLNNRKKLDEYFKKITADGDKPVSAIMIDVDNFKALNDAYGHKEGDCVLRVVARILKETLGGNHFISRYGGDEFYILLNIDETQKLEKIASDISRRINEYNRSSNKPYDISLSMGYDVYNSSKKNEDFFEHIDKLMYQNKRLSNKPVQKLISKNLCENPE